MSQPESYPKSDPDPNPIPKPDYAPDSFLLSKSAELDWLDRNAYIERKDSGKSHTNNTTNPNLITTSSSSSQRFAVNFKSSTSIFGLPKPSSNHQRQCSVRVRNLWLIPRRSSGKSAVSEPGSPKVSCMGRVRSKRSKGTKKKGKNRTGFWGSVKGFFRSGRGNTTTLALESKPEEKKEDEAAMKVEKAVVVAPRLGAVQRFSSGRRSDAWAGDAETGLV